MTASTDVLIRRTDISSPIVQQLILALNAELEDRYPEEGANHFRLDADEVADGRGAFLVAYRDGQAVGCGAVRRNEPEVAEIKRMYVIPEVRGRGIARQVLIALEAEARKLGVSRLVLETGLRQIEALALYRRAGFVELAFRRILRFAAQRLYVKKPVMPVDVYLPSPVHNLQS